MEIALWRAAASSDEQARADDDGNGGQQRRRASDAIGSLAEATHWQRRLSGEGVPEGGGVGLTPTVAVERDAERDHDFTDEWPEDGGWLRLLPSLDRREEWSYQRRIHHAWGSRDKKGHAEGTQRALRAAHEITLVCDDCGSLVAWVMARKDARADGRQRFNGGDGCGSRGCSRAHKPAQFTKRQIDMAAKLRGRDRALAVWPDEGLRVTALQLLPWVEACEAADAAEDAAVAAAAVRRQRKRRRDA